jgi:hypothetical protein
MSLFVGLRTSASRGWRIQFVVPHQFTSTLAAGSVGCRESKFGVVHRRFDPMTIWSPACAGSTDGARLRLKHRRP